MRLAKLVVMPTLVTSMSSELSPSVETVWLSHFKLVENEKKTDCCLDNERNAGVLVKQERHSEPAATVSSTTNDHSRAQKGDDWRVGL